MSEKYWLVVQYPLKSAKGSQRDEWLRSKVTEYLNLFLEEAELGYVDGYDMGRSVADPAKYVLNLFCVVTDEQRAISLVKRVLKEHRLDYTRISIATMPYAGGGDGTYMLKYASKKGVTEFSL
ncbi:hypothetical protein [Paenibacillus piscarius]|uniref:hypothetical protein n=1 Tax=Paenibacillus piscarius TaxID=1089681 RepID=UPI001EE97DE4|nr:hypothetical protein [Paenibacillus piscarius]